MPALNSEHPDADRKPGDKMVVDGLEWTFGRNQYSSFWNARRAATVTCCAMYPDVGPYVSLSRVFDKFEDAAKRSIRGAEEEYERAKDVVRRYENA